MFEPYFMPWIIVFTILQLAAPAYFIGRRVARGELRVRFSLGSLFAFVTLMAMSCGILRLDWPWPFKWMILFGSLMCAFGLVTSRLPPPARSKGRGDD